MTDQLDLDNYRHEALVGNTAQGVRNYLIEMNNNRANMRARWIWELLQNARDASTYDGLVSVVDHSENELIFRHNGREFEYEEITHLIYYGSTKVENKGALGRYGTGFLTTHLLSAHIDVSGHLKGGRSFDFSLVREIASPQSLSISMDKAWDKFKASLTDNDVLKDFTTRFRYPIGDDSSDVVEDGIASLKQSAPLVLVLNHQFQRIDIEAFDEQVSFEVVNRESLPLEALQKVTVTESKNGHQIVSEYILAQSEDGQTSVAVPLGETNGGKACLAISQTPRLFLGFPLVGTGGFSFPGVINGFEFTPMENRDGVYLGQADNEANATNQATIEKACDLLTKIVCFASSYKCKDIHTLAEIPSIPERTWINENWLQDCLNEHLVKPLRTVPAVICEFGSYAIAPEEAILPFAENDTAVESLWDLLSDLEEFRQRLPRRNEAVGWCNAVKSWANVLKCELTEFGEIVDGHRLAEFVEAKAKVSGNGSYGKLENLREALGDDVCAAQWLDEVLGFLKQNGFADEITKRCIVLDQDGYLDRLTNLYRDKSIDGELKDISETLDLNLLQELRDNRLASLVDEIGKGDRDNENVVQGIIAKLREIGDKDNLDEAFTNVSARLFAWIVRNREWEYMRDYPAFSRPSGRDGNILSRITLRQGTKDDVLSLAPVPAWPENLQPFADVFPPNRILADAFYNSVSDINDWKSFESRKLVRTSVMVNEEMKFDSFLPDEPLPDGEHETSPLVRVTNLAFITGRTAGSMERIRNSQSRARLFWSFLTEWVIYYDSDGLDVKKADCVCGESHGYYPAAWLVPLVGNNWVPLENDRHDRVNAESLARLLQGSDALPIPDNEAVNKLLGAIGVTRLDLTRFATPEGSRAALDSELTNIISASGNNPDSLRHVPLFLEKLNDNPDLIQKIEQIDKKRREVQRNQELGNCVEDLVRENLEAKGFSVTKTHKGSDLEISAEAGDVVGLKIDKSDKRWLIEVKSTRKNKARMTPTQAKEAVTEGDGFLLCVVPVETEGNPKFDDVRTGMRFVEKIGERTKELCDDLDGFERRRKQITYGNIGGVQLEVESGNAMVSIASSVWESDGFCLDDLPTRLK